MRNLSVPFAYFLLAIFLVLSLACGSTGNSSSTNPGNGSGSGSGSGSGGSGGSGSGSGSSSSFVSYAYAATTSTISGYGVNANGSLTSVSGSPYSVSTAQNANIVTNGANLYAIAQGQINLDVFSIDKASGSLKLVNTTSAITGDPNSSDMASGLAFDHTGASLHVSVGFTNQDGGINVFTVGNSSNVQQMQFLATSALAPSPLVFSPNNQYAYSYACSARVEGIFVYARASDGTLQRSNDANVKPPTGNPGEAFCPAALAVSAKGYVSVVWQPFQFASSGTVGNETYVTTNTINSDGSLTAVSGSQVKTASTSANKVAVNFDPSGSFLAVAGDGGIQTYALIGNGTLTPAGTPQNAGANFQSVAWDNSNHVFATNSNQLYVFNSSNGVLTPGPGSPYVGGPTLAVLPLQ